jgi:hypothetical protein
MSGKNNAKTNVPAKTPTMSKMAGGNMGSNWTTQT